ncbi:MAG: ribonuclease D [Pseudomonadota bacterium]
MLVIEDAATLGDFCETLRRKPFFAVDTEFMREKTYWPILCLIQAAADGAEAIIDPLAKDMDLSPFLDLLIDPSIVKVFHAARQDIEIFYKLLGQTPAPMFDTQIAAMACGFGDQIGYEPLMRSLLGARIDKGSRFTDWSRRPLSEKQLTYALSDVTHLRDAYPILSDKLKRDGRTAWIEEEIDNLLNPALYAMAPEEAWRRLKLRGVRRHEIGPIMKLAEWREREAQTRDQPRNRIIKDDVILELARMKPTTATDLGRARSLPNGMEKSRLASGLLTAVADGVALDQSDLPRIEKNENRTPPPADVVDFLKVLLKRQCEAFDVAPRLIASMADLEALALDQNADIPAMKGWRREVFGARALSVIRGEIAMRLVDGQLEFIDL